MRVAIIPPPRLAQALSGDQSYHLVLPQWQLSNPRASIPALEFYRICRELGQTIILDNGAHELGTAVPHRELFRLIDNLYPTHVVLPDTLFNAVATASEARSFIAGLRYERVRLPQQHTPEFVICPQGTTVEEWLWCLSEICREIPPHMSPILGVSKDYEIFPTSSLVELANLAEWEGPIHFLGLSRDPMKTLGGWQNASSPEIGFDTSKPIVYAYYGIELSDDLSSWEVYPGRPSNYDELGPEDIDLSLARENIDALLRGVDKISHGSDPIGTILPK